MKRILFVDVACPAAYSTRTLYNEALGGTEATVVRIAERMGAEHYVRVLQAPRQTAEQGRGNVTYAPMEEAAFKDRWDAVIVLRTPLPLMHAAKVNRDNKLYLWLHDLAHPALTRNAKVIEQSGAKVVCVSKFHQQHITEALRAVGCEKFTVTHVYNPVDNMLQPDSTPVDKNKLVFFSSPHKGLAYALHMFKQARNFNPAFRLFICNPGYYPDFNSAEHAGVVNLGKLRHAEAVDHVRSALCVFYPNIVFPETFGLVFAEANAVGTPVLTHNFGAASEVLDHPAQTLDCKDAQKTINRLMAWHGDNRPTVRVRPQFRLQEVYQQWAKLLGI